MRILIEYYKYDTLIEGKDVGRKELQKMFNKAIKLRNNNYDGFAELFCELFDFKVLKVIHEKVCYEEWDYILDIDTDLILSSY
ncbi:MAG: hypothetical protein FWE13_02550 [Firmicutes bacterium]|nr:hypothetical protein [Bacillota bacterium]